MSHDPLLFHCACHPAECSISGKVPEEALGDGGATTWKELESLSDVNNDMSNRQIFIVPLGALGRIFVVADNTDYVNTNPCLLGWLKSPV